MAFRDYHEGSDKPIITLVFDKQLTPIGGVYETERHFEKDGFMSSARTGSTNYSSYPEQFPNNGVYDRPDKKPNITYEGQGGITYGHAAAELNFGKGKSVGFNLQGGNYLIGVTGNTFDGGEIIKLKTDQMNIVAEGGIFNLSGNIGGNYNLKKGEFSNLDYGIGIGISDKLKPTNTSGTINSNNTSTFIGLETNFAVGIGIKLKLGLNINKQPKLSKFEKIENEAIKEKNTNPSNTKQPRA